eukprot:7390851-Prymnesium_polylepis.1
MVQIIAQGPLERVQSFSQWCERQVQQSCHTFEPHTSRLAQPPPPPTVCAHTADDACVCAPLQLDIDDGKVDVVEMDVEACPAVPLSSKFMLADMPRGKGNLPWRTILESSYDDLASSSTKLHSSDEGLA